MAGDAHVSKKIYAASMAAAEQACRLPFLSSCDD